MSIDIEKNYDKSVTVQRLDDEESTQYEEYVNYLTGVACHIQPLDDSYTQDIEGNFGKEWLMFCGVRDILEGDRVVDGSIQYRVTAVESFRFLGQDRHMEIRLRRSNP